MKNIEELKSSLPLTFQNAEIKKLGNVRGQKMIAVDYIDTEAMTPYNFYRPISKTIAL